jgi:selenocysteine lyase/cysteine desulfurase
MEISRRALLAVAGAAAASPAVASPQPPGGDFRTTGGTVLLNNAGTHPLYGPAADAEREYLSYKQTGEFPKDYAVFRLAEGPRASFAKLINAAPDEVALTQSTSMGENLIVAGLGLPGGKGNIVTDALHHEGSLYMYRSIASRDLEVRVAPYRDGRILLEDLDRLIDRDTRLVAISFVSWVNGFEHDLKAVCDIAHGRGALVYVDLIQGAGMVPVDVRATGVDFCACATYKWLMADCGVAFVYVRADLLDRVKRSQWGFMQFDHLEYHAFPRDPPGDWVMSWRPQPGARGRLEVGTPSFAAIVAAGRSLDFILATGVETINAKVRPLVERLQDRMPRLGFVPMTPRDSRSAITTFLAPEPEHVKARLAAHRVQARLMGRQLRISPALHNSADDVEKLLTALAA